MLPPVESQHDNLFTHHTEIDSVRKTRQHRSTDFAVRSLERQGIRRHAHNEFIDGEAELQTESFASRFVLLADFERVIFGLRPENNPLSHAQPNNFRRTSDQGTAEPGFSTCSAHRRSNSARCSSVSPSSPSRSASVRLSQSAMANSAGSPAGSLRSWARGIDCMG
jgi:hypothetical protein